MPKKRKPMRGRRHRKPGVTAPFNKAAQNKSGQDRNPDQVLLIACLNNNTQRVRAALSHPDVNINIRDEQGCTPLIRAAIRGNPAVIELLLKSGADVHMQDNEGNNAIHYLASNSYEAKLGMMLDLGVNPDVKNKKGQTSLMLASIKNHFQCAKLLLKAGADPNICDQDQDNALFYAAYAPSDRITQELIDHDISIEHKNCNDIRAINYLEGKLKDTQGNGHKSRKIEKSIEAIEAAFDKHRKLQCHIRNIQIDTQTADLSKYSTKRLLHILLCHNIKNDPIRQFILDKQICFDVNDFTDTDESGVSAADIMKAQNTIGVVLNMDHRAMTEEFLKLAFDHLPPWKQRPHALAFVNAKLRYQYAKENPSYTKNVLKRRPKPK